MASPTPKRRPVPPAPASEPPLVVEPMWLLKALGLTVLFAATLGYLSVCLLLYQGSWQRFLSPSHVVDKTPAAPFDRIRFDAAETGQPRLTGWWIPSDSSAAPTMLFLHDGAGSLASAVPTLNLLHKAGVNIFAFDYRGFGESDPTHPNEKRMGEDATAAFHYLLDTRHLNVSSIVPYGQGLGAVLAANLTKAQAGLPAIILDDPDPEIYNRIAGESRARFLPMQLLIRERFDLARALAGSTKPKLLLADSPFASQPDRVRVNQAFFRGVPGPKLTVTFPAVTSPANAVPAYLESLHRFLDEYVPSPLNNMKPGATP